MGSRWVDEGLRLKDGHLVYAFLTEFLLMFLLLRLPLLQFLFMFPVYCYIHSLFSHKSHYNTHFSHNSASTCQTCTVLPLFHLKIPTAMHKFVKTRRRCQRAARRCHLGARAHVCSRADGTDATSGYFDLRLQLVSVINHPNIAGHVPLSWLHHHVGMLASLSALEAL